MKKIEELFLPYELAVIAKEKGFDDWCFAVYTPEFKCVSHYGLGEEFTGMWKASETKGIPTPLHQEIIDWFIKKEIFINWELQVTDVFEYYGTIHLVRDYNKVLHFKSDKKSDNYKALNEAIKEAFKLI